MLAQAVICPACKASLKLSAPVGVTVAKCPRCGGAIPLNRIPDASNTDHSSADAPLGIPVQDTASSVAGPGSREEPTAGNGTLASPTEPPPSGEFPFLAPAQQPDELGRLGPYRVLGVLGAGGMGVVFRAEDPVVRRQIALKVMLPQYASNSTAKARFLREARAQAAVEHDHIIVLYQVAEERGVPFIAMPLLKGQTLADALKANPNVPIGEAIRIAREMASGLAAAHEQHLIHRDIKPANVWLEGKHRRVKVLDFGLARAEADGPDAVTQEGMIIGTPPYMSPEQAAGEPLDARTDLFSLGVVLYQMLTGKQPFMGKSTPAILMAVTTHTPPHPMELNPQVPPELDALTMRLLAKSAVDRPANAEAVVEALRVVESSMNRTAQIPVVYYAPPAAAEAAPDPWAAIVDTEADAEPVEEVTEAMEASPASRASHGTGSEGRKRKPWLLIASLLAFVGVAAVAADIIIKVKNKDGTEVELKVPDGSTVTVNKDGKTLGKFGPDPKKEGAKTPPTGPYDDRKAAEWVIGLGGGVAVNGSVTEMIKAAADLPKDSFTLTGLFLNGTQVSDAGLAYFKDCKTLRQLVLSSTQVTDAGLAHFKDCKSLASLDLLETDVTDAGLAYLKDCKNLQNLNLASTKVTDTGLAHFNDCKNLTSLTLGNTKATDTGLAHFKNCKSLTLLNLHTTSLTDVGLALFKDCSNLTILNLGYTQVTDTGLVHFKERKSLTHLILSGTQVTDAGLNYFKECNNLKHLEVKDTQVSDAGLALFKDCKNLAILRLQKTKVTAKGVEEFAKALPGCKIEWDGGTIEPKVIDDRQAAEFALSLGGWIRVRVGEQEREIRAVAHLPKEPVTMLKLDLRETNVTDEELANFKDCKSLVLLSLTGCKQVSDAGLVHFRNCQELLGLGLSATQVTDAGMAYFKDCKGLTTLNLPNTKVGDAGLSHFTDCQQLTMLALGGTKVSDKGLASFKNCKNLTTLHLGFTQVTDAGLEHCAEMKSLTSLNLTNTKVTEAGVKKLAAALPGCKIEWDGGTIEPKVIDDRKAAEWVIALGGFVYVNGERNEITAVNGFPKAPFTLTGLALRGPQVTDAALAPFKDCKNLKQLNLTGVQVSDSGLANFKDCKNLTDLALPYTNITDAGLAQFKDSNNLTYLQLSSTEVTDAGLAHFKDCKNLMVLYVGGTKVSDTGLSHFKDCTNLSSLDITRTRVTDTGLAYFKDRKNLTWLMLGRTEVTDAGLSNFKECKNLVRLEVNNTQVTDTGLASFRDCKSLTYLRLNDTQVSDAGLAHFKDCKNLTYLDVRKTKVTAKVVEEFAKALPGCKIEWDGGVIEPKK